MGQMGLKDDFLFEKTFTLLDVDKDGSLSFSEFAAMGLVFFRDLVEERLAALFLEHDEDGDGTLNEIEVAAFLDNAIELLGTARGRSGEILSQLRRGQVTFEDLR